MVWLALVLLLVSLPVGWLMTLVGLPGNWVMVAAVALYAYLVPQDSSLAIGWQTVLALGGMALVGEVVETASGAVTAGRVGARRRSMLLAIVGSIVGSFLGAGIGLPLPVVGWVIGAILFSAVGATVGALLGEWSAGSEQNQAMEVGKAAFWGRVFGAVGKLAVASAMVAVALLAVVF
jgi:uncharacterized protein YqgC (DUF456 family)